MTATGHQIQMALSRQVIHSLDYNLGEVKRKFNFYTPCHSYQVGKCDHPDFSYPSRNRPNGRFFSHICMICWVRAKLPFHHNLATCPFTVTSLDNITQNPWSLWLSPALVPVFTSPKKSNKTWARPQKFPKKSALKVWKKFWKMFLKKKYKSFKSLWSWNWRVETECSLLLDHPPPTSLSTDSDVIPATTTDILIPRI